MFAESRLPRPLHSRNFRQKPGPISLKSAEHARKGGSRLAAFALVVHANLQMTLTNGHATVLNPTDLNRIPGAVVVAIRMLPTHRSPETLALGGLLALAAAMGIGRFVYTPILPFMLEAKSLSAADAGLVAAANFLGYLVGALAGAARSLPGNPRTWFLGGLLASALTSAAMAAASELSFFLVIRFASGVASAFVLVFSTTLVLERLNVAGRPQLSALHFAGVGCGIAFSALLIAGLERLGST